MTPPGPGSEASLAEHQLGGDGQVDARTTALQKIRQYYFETLSEAAKMKMTHSAYRNARKQAPEEPRRKARQHAYDQHAYDGSDPDAVES